MRRFALSALAALAFGLTATTPNAAEGPALPKEHWPFAGVFGTFDRGALNRGFQVHKEVCSACHSLSLIYYRHLAGIGLTAEEIRAIAAEKEVTDGPNDEGDMFKRPGRPSDRYVAPFANENASRSANNGAYPPDLSLMIKARKGGPDYLYAILTGYKDAPADVRIMDGMHYNEFFPGHQIAMPMPLSEGGVTFADGTAATVGAMARDVTTFLAWTAEPEMEQRKQLGVKVVLFLIVFSGLTYAVKRKVWADLHA